MTETIVHLPKLEQLNCIDRRLTVSEYYHASIGRNSRSLIRPREVVFIIEGEVSAAPIEWQSALDQAAAMNPGSRLRLVGKRQNARWVNDGQPPQLRFIPECDWDGRSENGAEFLYSTALSLEEGRTGELIIAGQEKPKVIFRVSHAVMDGLGALHFLQELFRALRGEPLLGSNATYTDSELMLSVQSERSWDKFIQPSYITGGAQGTERGGTWRRISIAGPQPNLMARIILILVELSRLNSERSIRIAIPSNLRRHDPQLLATMNFSSMPYIDFEPGKIVDIDDIKARLKDIQSRNIDANYKKIFELVRYLPFSWVDGLLSITEKNYTAPTIRETAVLTVLGSFKKSLYCGGGFSAECIYVLPQLDNIFVTVTGLQGQFEVCVGMPRVFASNGRMEEFLRYIETRLG